MKISHEKTLLQHIRSGALKVCKIDQNLYSNMSKLLNSDADKPPSIRNYFGQGDDYLKAWSIIHDQTWSSALPNYLWFAETYTTGDGIVKSQLYVVPLELHKSGKTARLTNGKRILLNSVNVKKYLSSEWQHAINLSDKRLRRQFKKRLSDFLESVSKLEHLYTRLGDHSDERIRRELITKCIVQSQYAPHVSDCTAEEIEHLIDETIKESRLERAKGVWKWLFQK